MAKKKDKDAEAKKPAEEGAEKEGKKKGSMLPAIIVAVAVLAGGAMAGGLVGGGGDAAAAAPAPEPTPTPMELGAVTELESITLNLAGGDGHFLKLGVAIETGADVAEPPATAPVYDIIIARFSDYTMEELSEPGVRERTKEELLADLEAVFGGAISRLYYTEFVMQ